MRRRRIPTSAVPTAIFLGVLVLVFRSWSGAPSSNAPDEKITPRRAIQLVSSSRDAPRFTTPVRVKVPVGTVYGRLANQNASEIRIGRGTFTVLEGALELEGAEFDRLLQAVTSTQTLPCTCAGYFDAPNARLKISHDENSQHTLDLSKGGRFDLTLPSRSSAARQISLTFRAGQLTIQPADANGQHLLNCLTRGNDREDLLGLEPFGSNNPRVNDRGTKSFPNQRTYLSRGGTAKDLRSLITPDEDFDDGPNSTSELIRSWSSGASKNFLAADLPKLHVAGPVQLELDIRVAELVGPPTADQSIEAQPASEVR